MMPSSCSSTMPPALSSTTRSSSVCSVRSQRAYDGVVPGLPLADTVKRVDGGFVVETVDRADLVTVQTPQAFAAAALRAAYRGSGPIDATDCASLVEAGGGRIRVVEGDVRLHEDHDGGRSRSSSSRGSESRLLRRRRDARRRGALLASPRRGDRRRPARALGGARGHDRAWRGSHGALAAPRDRATGDVGRI